MALELREQLLTQQMGIKYNHLDEVVRRLKYKINEDKN